MIITRIGHVVIDPVALQRFVTTGGGPVLRDHKRRAANVQTGAKVYVRKRTRALERSIVTRTEAGPLQLVTTIGTDLRYAMWEHEGTRPHVILPRNRKVLRFPVGGAGGFSVVFARKVNHPGTKGSFFLARALPLALV